MKKVHVLTGLPHEQRFPCWLLVGLSENQLGQWLSKGGCCITWEFVPNANWWVLLLNYEIRNSGAGLSHFISPPSDSDPHSSLRTTKLRHKLSSLADDQNFLGVVREEMQVPRPISRVSESSGSRKRPQTQHLNMLPG